ncbi:Mur ligase family protein [Helicobacter colisuis]|uniref:Mur ligase family protein n=1 Tax=Helicobacter colisuis TaxID=2949739 RepID=UPI00202A08A2|nr:Mur ligase family protein [Helicobacter colisuis]MCL9822356.1 Mur ligase family protein [Helicobacter colisuis]
MNELKKFLEKKGVEYAPFDPKRAPKILETLKIPFLKPKVIHIVGTNGKGSTGRFLALMLHQQGLDVGHFTSPHLFSIEERFWRNGKNITLETLENAFLEFDLTLLKEASYFEILTFLALKVFGECDYLVLEAGLGGEFDSTTTCVKRDLTLFSAIDIDHQEFLGESLESIAKTKLNAMAKKAILGIQSHFEVIRIAQKIAQEKQIELEILDIQSISPSIKEYCKKHHYARFQEENLALAYSGFKALGFDMNLKELKALDLQGRAQQIAPNIWVDVLHNPNGARAILKNFSKEKYILVYNSYLDKNPKEILKILKPIIKRVEIIEISSSRRIPKIQLEDILRGLDLEFTDFCNIKKDEKYLVCGSFCVVAEFLKRR